MWNFVLHLCDRAAPRIVVMLLLIVGLVGCRPPTLTEIQEEVFSPSCAFSSCHGGESPEQGLDLSDGNSYASAVGQEAQAPGYTLVEPGEPEASLLLLVLRQDLAAEDPEDEDPLVRQMPIGTSLDSNKVQMVEDWIESGAPND